MASLCSISPQRNSKISCPWNHRRLGCCTLLDSCAPLIALYCYAMAYRLPFNVSYVSDSHSVGLQNAEAARFVQRLTRRSPHPWFIRRLRDVAPKHLDRTQHHRLRYRLWLDGCVQARRLAHRRRAIYRRLDRLSNYVDFLE